jgi:hypothetical protein
MRLKLLTVLTVGALVSHFACDKSTEPVQNQSIFQAKINGSQKSGAGAAYLYSDTLLHIRGRFAESGYKRQIDIIIDTVGSGKYQISKNNGLLMYIIGGDGVTNHHSTFGLPNDSISYEIDFSKQHLTGDFNAIFVDSLSHDTLKVTNGMFDIYY